MSAVHRLLALVTLPVMLFLGVTGTMIQAMDLHAFLTKAPADHPTMLSIRAGMYGEDRGYPFITPADFVAAPLPSGLDHAAAFAGALRALHAAAPGEAPRYVELRMAGGRLVGQAGLGEKRVLAFDVASGAPAEASGPPIGRAPPSARLTVKKYHRFWLRSESPGVWLELLSGIALCALVVGGLVLQVRQRRRRASLPRGRRFWFEDGRWRGLHRLLTASAALFLLPIGFTGAWIGFDSVVHMLRPVSQEGDISAPLGDAQVQGMVAATLDAMRRHAPGVSIRVLRVRMFGPMAQGAVVTGESDPRQLVFDLADGRPVTLTEPGYPPHAFPFGLQWHEYVKYAHSFFLFGRWTQWFGLYAGVALVLLSLSGLVMELELWRGRRRG